MMDARHGVLLASGLLVFSWGAAASSLAVEPDNLDLDLAAGSDVTRDLDVSYSGDTSVVAEVNYSVTAESTNTKGLVVEVSPREFILEPSESRTVELGVSSNHTLKPDNFTVRVNAVTEVETETVSSDSEDDDDGDSGGGSIDIDLSSDDSGTGNDDEEDGGEVGESPDRNGEKQSGSDQSPNTSEELRDRVNELRESLETEENRTQRLENRLNETEGNRTGTGRANTQGTIQRVFDTLFSSLLRAVFPFF